MKRPIADVIPDLAPRPPGETPPEVRARLGLDAHTFVFGQLDGGGIDGIVEDCLALQGAGWIEAFVVLSRSDGLGEFVSVLVRREQALGLLQVNAWYRLAERVEARAFVLADFPAWARIGNDAEGGPLHVFYGVEIPEDEEPNP